MVYHIKEVRLTPEEVLFKQGDINDHSLYIIRKGEIDLYLQSNEKKEHKIKKLKEGDILGEVSFFSKQARTASAKSKDFTTLFTINLNDFLRITQKLPFDFEKYCEIKDSILNYNSYKDIYTRCFSCKEDSHIVGNCPYLHFKPNAQLCIDKYNYSVDNQRSKEIITRKIKRANNSRVYFIENKEEAQIFKEIELDKNSFNEDALLETISINEEERKENLKESLKEIGTKSKLSKFRKLGRVNTLDVDFTMAAAQANNSDQLKMKKSIASISPPGVLVSSYVNPIIENDEIPFQIKDIDFETVKSYKKYFPEFNIDKIVEKFNDIRIKKFLLKTHKNLNQSVKKRSLPARRSFSYDNYEGFLRKSIKLQRKSKFTKQNSIDYNENNNSNSFNKETFVELTKKFIAINKSQRISSPIIWNKVKGSIFGSKATDK